MLAVDVVTVLPPASWTVTTGCVDHAVPAVPRKRVRRNFHRHGARAAAIPVPQLPVQPRRVGRGIDAAFQRAGKTVADRARHRAGPEGAAAAAPRYPHHRQSLGRQRAEGDIAEKGIGQRHAVQQHQRPARRIAAQPAQGNALARRMCAAPVGATELDDSGLVAQAIFDPRAETRI